MTVNADIQQLTLLAAECEDKLGELEESGGDYDPYL